MNSFHGTTILSVRNEAGLAMGGDGQVTLGDAIMKANTVKVRTLFNAVSYTHLTLPTKRIV